MNRPEAERARALLGRADADLAAVRALEAVETVPDEVVGFHAQQAVEKLLKAVLAAHDIDFPRTHSIPSCWTSSPTTNSQRRLSSTESPSSTLSLSSFAMRRRSMRRRSTAGKRGSCSSVFATGQSSVFQRRSAPADPRRELLRQSLDRQLADVQRETYASDNLCKPV